MILRFKLNFRPRWPSKDYLTSHDSDVTSWDPISARVSTDVSITFRNEGYYPSSCKGPKPHGTPYSLFLTYRFCWQPPPKNLYSLFSRRFRWFRVKRISENNDYLKTSIVTLQIHFKVSFVNKFYHLKSNILPYPNSKHTIVRQAVLETKSTLVYYNKNYTYSKKGRSGMETR